MIVTYYNDLILITISMLFACIFCSSGSHNFLTGYVYCYLKALHGKREVLSISGKIPAIKKQTTFTNENNYYQFGT